MSRPGPLDSEAEASRQRIDRWLLCARIVKTRGLAQLLVAGGHVRVNGQRIDAPGRAVRAGDVLTIALERSVRVLRVTGFAERRGPASQARLLYENVDEEGRPGVLAPGPQSG